MKWVLKCLNADAKNCPSNFWNFFCVIQMITCHDWWPWTKPGYITMTWRQSNNQWSGSIVVHPASKNSECKNPLQKFSPRFFGIKMASSSLIIFQRAKLSTWSITRLCWCNWRTFEGKTLWEGHPGGLVLAQQCPGSLGTAKLAYLGFQCLDNPPYSPDLAPSGYHLFPGLKTTIERPPFFVRRGGHCCPGVLVGRTTFWTFFESLAKVKATG